MTVTELQLCPSHKPYDIRQTWMSLVDEYGHANHNQQQQDEPKLVFQRNVFYPLHLEEKIRYVLEYKIEHNLFEDF